MKATYPPPVVPAVQDASRPGRLRRGAGWIMAAAGVLLSVLMFFVALLATAQTSENPFLAYAVAALVAGLVAAGVARLSVRVRAGRGRGRRGPTAAVCAAVSLLSAGGVSWAWFAAPVTYTALPDSADVQYWDLPTGSRIAYVRTAGTATHPEPVLMVHGGPGAPGNRSGEFAERLAAAGFTVYTYQQVGAGQSSRLDPSEYTVDRHVADLDAVRRKLGVPKVVLVGSSWGGQLVAEYLAAHPDDVAQAIVASPASMWNGSLPDGDLTPGGKADQSDRFAAHPRFAATMFAGSAGLLPAMTTLMSDRTADGLFQGFVPSLNMSAGCPGAPRDGRPVDMAGAALWVNVATSASAAEADDPRPALRRNPTPLLVLRSRCDYIRWEATREYRDTFPNATMLTFDRAGHSLLSDSPDETAAAAVAFLTGKPLPAEPYTAAEPPWHG